MIIYGIPLNEITREEVETLLEFTETADNGLQLYLNYLCEDSDPVSGILGFTINDKSFTKPVPLSNIAGDGPTADHVRKVINAQDKLGYDDKIADVYAFEVTNTFEIV